MFMKIRFFLFLFFPFLIFSGAVRAQTSAALEREILAEINSLRTNPAAYAKWIEDNRGSLPYNPQPGKQKTIDEAVKVLKSTAPLAALNVSPAATKAAASHVANQLPTGKFSHNGTDGSTADGRLKKFGRLIGNYGENAIVMNPNEKGIVEAKGIVLAWVIDDYVGSRAHRKFLLDKTFQFVGAACGKYPNSKIYPDYTLCVVDFAQQLQ